MNTDSRSRRWLAAFLVAVLAAHVVVTWRARTLLSRGYGDFAALYTAGFMLRHGMGRQLYDSHEQWRVQQELLPQVEIRKGPLPFIRPPFEAPVFVPFSYFEYPVALAIWSASQLALLWLTLRTLPRKNPFISLYPAWLETVLCLGFFPVFFTLYDGQDAIVLLFLIVLALKMLDAGRDSAAGALLGLGLFKFHLVIPIVIILVVVGRSRVLAGFVPAGVALAAVSYAIAGPAALYGYPAYLLKLNQLPNAGLVGAQNMPNFRGLLTLWVGRAPYPGPIHWLLLPLAIAGLGYAACIWRSRIKAGSTALGLGYSLTLVTVILTSYYAYRYDMTLTLIPLLAVGGPWSERVNRRTRLLLNAASLLLLCTPLYWAFARWDSTYLLCLPMLGLAVGLALAIKEAAPAAP